MMNHPINRALSCLVALAALVAGTAAVAADDLSPFENPALWEKARSVELAQASGAPPEAAPAAASAEAKPFVPFPDSMAPADVLPDLLGQEVTVTGEIVELRPSTSERSPHRLTLFHEDGRHVMVVYWPDVADRVERGMGTPKIGTKVSVRGRLQDFQGILQVRVTEPSQIRIEGRPDAPAAAAARPAAAPRTAPSQGDPDRAPRAQATPLRPGEMITLAEVLARDSGPVMFEAEVVEYRASWSPNSPNILTVGDGTRQIDVVAFPNNVPEIDKALTETGARVRITGRRNDYRGRPQVAVARPSGIASADAPKPATPEDVIAGRVVPGVVLPTVMVDHALEGRRLTIEGRILGVAPGTEAVYGTLADTEGEAIVEVPAKFASAMPTRGQARVTGTVAWCPTRSQIVLRVEDATGISAIP